MRTTYKLTEAEMRQFQRLRIDSYQGAAMNFWKYVAKTRALDPTTIISAAPTFTGLPLGHGKPWCFPSPLKCKKKPVYSERW